MKKKEMKRRIAELEAAVRERKIHEDFDKWKANRGTTSGGFGFGPRDMPTLRTQGSSSSTPGGRWNV